MRLIRPGSGTRRGRAARRLLTVLLVLAGAVSCANWDVLKPGSDDGQAPAGKARMGEARVGEAQGSEARAAAARKWGLDRVPLVAPPPPKDKPRLTTPEWADQGAGLIPAFTHVPTSEKIAFLTIDDGAAKDPRFLEMVRELKVPLSAFLTHESAAEDYGYFRDLHALGVSIHNHTVHHPQMTTLDADEQYSEICVQQSILQEEIGVRPDLFRPPYGDFDADTLAVAEECGARAAPLWHEEAFADRIDYGHDDQRFHPGDIILTHFNGPSAWGGTMTDMLRLVLNEVTEQGYALARLEDYV
ncbi:polysaccharide deacetylase family protein [Streptomyces sp. ISL-11]|uniref:polysaccharide deacetylase family protein n=1 Tax=Streptomyces sp. ISL-11 TaxID=2819174 RepID=UPI001BE7A4B6|nr:polysaccharide deacetylase family protein [Streptomyces sp. ISL-11]MBT2385314.1 polysaccharide deacetylase family protein [Streptomyces sp. ISL-11]